MNHQATAERLHSLYVVCLVIDLEYELTGTVSANTIEQMRKVMSEVQSSTKTRPEAIASAEGRSPVSAGSGLIGCTGAWATP